MIEDNLIIAIRSSNPYSDNSDDWTLIGNAVAELSLGNLQIGRFNKKGATVTCSLAELKTAAFWARSHEESKIEFRVLGMAELFDMILKGDKK